MSNWRKQITLIDVPEGVFLHQKQVNECYRDVTTMTAGRGLLEC